VVKTTIEINDALLVRAKRHAAGRGSTLRMLVEESLRRTLDDAEGSAASAELGDGRFRGRGLERGGVGHDLDAFRNLVDRERAHRG
jgi:hypothetical protein